MFGLNHAESQNKFVLICYYYAIVDFTIKMSSAVNNVPTTRPIQKIYPSVIQLATINNCIKCDEEGCDATFMSKSNYMMHLEKHHDKPQPTNNSIKQFFCPVTHCIHNKDQNHFNKMKLLKQHYLKTHAERNYMCDKCNKGFATETFKYKHMEVCGVIYKCLHCNCKYTSKEGLVTHCRRKNHSLPPPKIVNKPQLVLPKLSSTTQTVQIIPVFIQINNNIEPLKRVDIAVQTDSSVRPPFTKKSKSPIKRKSTRQTQTCVKKKSKISAETQTTEDCILRRAVLDAKIDETEEQNFKKCSSETQTLKYVKLEDSSMINSDLDFLDDVNSTNMLFQSSSCQTSVEPLKLEDYQNDRKCIETQTLIPMSSFDTNLTEDNTNFMKNNSPNMLLQSSGSQTNLDHLNIFEDSSFGNCNNSETQTDLIYKDEFLQSTVFTSHIETQTNEELDNYINMYTQTCDELFLSDLEFTNIQTQTNWPDYEMFVSTETQTLSSNINNNNNPATTDKTFLELGLSNREISHMETQTDMEFKQLLEEINA